MKHQIVKKGESTVHLVEHYVTLFRRSNLNEVQGLLDEEINLKLGSVLTKRGTTLVALSENEQNVYLPELIGSSPAKENWNKIRDEYFNNISVPINAITGKKLDISLYFKSEEGAKLYIKKHDLDQDVSEIAKPRVVEDYVLLKHALQHPRVANSKELIYKSPKIQFYIYDPSLEQQRNYNKALSVDKSLARYLELLKQDDKNFIIDSILRVKKVFTPFLDEKEKKTLIQEIAINKPGEFLSYFAPNYNLDIRGIIDKCVAAGIFKVPELSTMYIYKDEVIASNVEGLIAWWKSEVNTQEINIIKKTLEDYTNI